MSSIFTKIIKQEIPSYKIFEDALVYAFLDIRPIQKGHVLLVPKLEIDNFLDIESSLYLHLMKQAQMLSLAIQKATNCKRLGLIIAGYEVPHFHIHLIPTWSLEDFDFSKAQSLESSIMLDIQASIKSYI